QYERGGRGLDPHHPPAGFTRVNVGDEARPVWRLRRRTRAGQEQDARPSAVFFRLNTELVRELAGERGTIKFTFVARQVFGLLRRFAKLPKTIRLLLLVLRQTSGTLVRNLDPLLEDLGFDAAHRDRALEGLRESLDELREAGVVK